jgi:hypothetical protein
VEDIRDDQIKGDPGPPRRIYRGLPVRQRDDLITLIRQHPGDSGTDHGLVVHYQIRAGIWSPGEETGEGKVPHSSTFRERRQKPAKLN